MKNLLNTEGLKKQAKQLNERIPFYEEILLSVESKNIADIKKLKDEPPKKRD